MAKVLPTQDQVQIKLSSVAELRQHGERLFGAHAAESEPEMAKYLDLDWDKYLKAEAGGWLVALGAWAGLLLVGYAIASVFPHPHYAVTICQQDALYVERAWRGKRVGLELVDRLRDEARDHGCHHLLMHAKPGSKLMALLPKLGFEPEEATFKETL